MFNGNLRNNDDFVWTEFDEEYLHVPAQCSFFSLQCLKEADSRSSDNVGRMGWNSIKWNKIEDPGGIGLCRTSKDQKWIEFLLYIEWINKVLMYSSPSVQHLS